MTSGRSATPADRDLVLDARGLVKAYPGVTALRGADLQVRRGEVRALLGHNGAGKSTLVKVVAGVESLDEGQVFIAGSRVPTLATVANVAALGVATVHQELSLVPQMTVAENLQLGAWPRGRLGMIDRRGALRTSRELLTRFGVELDVTRLLGTLSLAQQQLVEIARALLHDPKLLILDEPTSSLASAEVDLVLATVERVVERGVGVIYVSHRMDEIRRVANTLTVMRDGQVVADADSARDLPTRDIVRLMLGDDHVEVDALELQPVPDDAAVLLEAQGLQLHGRLHDVDLQVRAGEVVGIAGLLGAGRTELLLALSGHLATDGGQILVDGKPVEHPTPRRMIDLGVGYTPEDRKRDGIVSQLGVDENLVMARPDRVMSKGLLSPSRRAAAADAVIDRLSVRVPTSTTIVGTLSGGNQQKVVIGRWLHAQSRVLLLDEPTRGIDVGSKAQIYELVRQFAASGNAVVLVSNELEELPVVCDRAVVLQNGTLRTEFTAPDIRTRDLLVASMSTED